MADPTQWRYPAFFKSIIVIVGGFGSGKTEVAVNLAKFMKANGHEEISLVDLDLVNPYFRTREAKGELKELGIDLIAPKGGKFYADLPILLPQVRSLVESPDGLLILDVGGDEQGTKALGSISDIFKVGEYDMLMVLNSRRPQTSNVATSLATMNRVEGTSRLKFTGLISNTHMIEETDADVVMEGYNLSKEISDKTGLPLTFVSAKRKVLEGLNMNEIGCPVLPLTRSLLKPWERKENTA